MKLREFIELTAHLPVENLAIYAKLFEAEAAREQAFVTVTTESEQVTKPVVKPVAKPVAKPAKNWQEFTAGLDDSDSFVYALTLIGKVSDYERLGWPFEFKQEYIKAIQVTGFKPKEHYDVGLVLAETDERLAEYSEMLIKDLTDVKAKALYENFAAELGVPKDEVVTPKSPQNVAKRFLALSRAADIVDSKFLHDAVKADIKSFSSGFVAREAAIEYLEELAPSLDICWATGAVVESIKKTRDASTAISIEIDKDWLIKKVWLDLVKPGKVNEDDFLALISFRKSFLAEFSASSDIDYLYGIAYLLTYCKQTKAVKDYAKLMLKDAKKVNEAQLADWATGASQDVYDYLYTFEGFFDKMLPLRSNYDAAVQGV